MGGGGGGGGGGGEGGGGEGGKKVQGLPPKNSTPKVKCSIYFWLFSQPPCLFVLI